MKSEIANVDIPQIVDSEVIEMIKYKWEIAARKKIGGELTSQMFSEWIEILNDCIEGNPLGNELNHSNKVDRIQLLRSFETFLYE